ncbi:hypothetical protein KME66_17615 [Streptomyces sp. YPW6]|uniref:hypothetical protein n=1 Tax=Streptomyces sp. YPW6 TaxID=2840373 RepID=UPI001C0DFA90|nr:hypothetical protein [Streptomyces sp. YPW6]QWQ42619.1 hypothetical protein KME66_17615 [Streptomyces sp. YPW6]
MNGNLGPLAVTRLSGAEPIQTNGETVGSLGGFWSWAYSDVSNNALRGVLAEYIVAMALGAAAGTRIGWDAVDIRTSEQWSVEVKSTAYLQSWTQARPSAPSFDIEPKGSWDPETNTTSTEKRRHADVYVFCLLHHQNKLTLDPLDLGQWTFFVLPTRVLNDRHPHQKTITPSSLQRLDPLQVDFAGLAKAVALCAEDTR